MGNMEVTVNNASEGISWELSWDTFKRHSDLVTSVAIFSLNSCVMAAKASRQVPNLVGHSANVALSYVGVISTPAQVHYLGKTWSDVTRAVRDRDMLAIGPVAVKVANEAVNVLLTVGNFVAAVAKLVNRPAFAIAFYATCRPVAVAGTVATIFVDLFGWVSNSRLITRLDGLQSGSDAKVQQLFRDIVSGETTEDPDLKHLTTLVQRTLDRDTWNALAARATRSMEEGDLTGEEARALLATVQKYCARQDEFYKAGVGLRALGYAAMAVCRANPDTLVQSITLWGMGLLYTSKLAYEKVAQAGTRAEMV